MGKIKGRGEGCSVSGLGNKAKVRGIHRDVFQAPQMQHLKKNACLGPFQLLPTSCLPPFFKPRHSLNFLQLQDYPAI